MDAPDITPLVHALQMEHCPQRYSSGVFLHDPALPLDHDHCFLHYLAAQEIVRLQKMLVDLGVDPGLRGITTDIDGVRVGGEWS